MADEPKPDIRGSQSKSDPGSGPGEGSAAKRERDFGDSAGYGGGGSTLDHREVGDAGASGTAGKHNPLDDVMDSPETAGCSS